MAVPDFQSLMLPLLNAAGDGQQHSLAEAVERLAEEFHLSEDDREQLLKSGQTRLYNRVGWAGTYLRKAGLLQGTGRGRFQLTERGREVLAERPKAIDVAFLEARFPEMQEFRARGSGAEADEEPPASFNAAEGTWILRPGVEERIGERIERAIPDVAILQAALELLASAIEHADAERANAWYVRETDHGLKLMAGRLLACELKRATLRVSVIGDPGDGVRAAIEADAEDYEFKKLSGARLLTFSVEHSTKARELLEPGLVSFIEAAMGRVRRSVSLEDHAPEGVAYVSRMVHRELPQPTPLQPSDESEEVAGDEEGATSREPCVRGRAPIFELGQRSIASLMSDIEHDVIALPDLQRPFVWEDTKVRDLLDSLFLGFPVGTLVLWHASTDKEARALGAERPGLGASTLVIDGQQRLTSLFAVTKGMEIVGKDGATRKIAIAFRPRDGRFEVTDAAIRNDPEFLADVTELWSGARTKPQIRKDLINALRDGGRVINEAYEDAVERNIDRAHSITDYRFPTVDIRKTAATRDEEASEEDVAEIFVRINNQGTRLGQADFVLTLLSVFHGDLRDRIELRARAMSEGAIVAIDTQQLLRAVCGVAFGRARMSAVYRYLRGVDPITGDADAASRAERLSQLDAAAKECLEPTPWRDYSLRVKHAGFVAQALVASKNAIVNAYTFYIRGRRAGVPKAKLDGLIARWIFASLLTARYSSASETAFEQDLARVGRLQPGDTDGYIRALDDAVSETLSGDYWAHSLVAALETQKGRAPSALAFRAAQIVLGTRALFSDQLLQNLLDPPAQGARSASELHHLFPRTWLESRGIKERRRINQVANLADTGWYENNVIGGRGPADYVPRIRKMLNIDDERWGRMCAEHALPPDWESMDYEEFLRERRRRMADIIRVAYRQLGGEAEAPPLTPPWFLPGTEVVWQAIVKTERALRGLVREVYATRFGDNAPRTIEQGLPERERETLARALRARPAGADALSIVDYLYLGQLLPLLFMPDAWRETRTRLGDAKDVKQRLQSAVDQIAPVRNEIAHIREVGNDRLLRANLACTEILDTIRDFTGSKPPSSKP